MKLKITIKTIAMIKVFKKKNLPINIKMDYSN